jgi:predicted Zn-ribbon and HTH transcriptional regulator
MTTQKQISTVTQKSQVTTKVVSGLKCPDCLEKQVTIKVIRGVIVAGSAKCSACGWSVRVARLNDGVIGKCPCCGSFAFPALGWCSGKQPFVALSCEQCGWVASETYMQAVGILLSTDMDAATTQSGNGQSDQVRRESNRTIDGVPAPFEAALQAFYRGDRPVCPFCGQRYRELEAERVGFGEIIVVTLLRCGCGVFPVKAEVLRD